MRDKLIDWVIRQCGLDPDNSPDDRWLERKLRQALKPVQKWWNRLSLVFWVLLWTTVIGGFIFGIVDCAKRDMKRIREDQAEWREKQNQEKVDKCKVWAGLHDIDAKWRRNMQLCMGKKEDGSLFTIDLDGGYIKKLKGRD